jgi:hypothetical protein
MRHSGVRRVEKPRRMSEYQQVRYSENDDGPARTIHHTSRPSCPPSRGFNERKGHLSTAQLNHTETQDRLSWWDCLVSLPVWRRSL